MGVLFVLSKESLRMEYCSCLICRSEVPSDQLVLFGSCLWCWQRLRIVALYPLAYDVLEHVGEVTSVVLLT